MRSRRFLRRADGKLSDDSIRTDYTGKDPVLVNVTDSTAWVSDC